MNWLENKLEISHSNNSPLKPMEGLRGIAVFLVFLVHYCSQIKPYINDDAIEITILNNLHKLGNVGVDLFFILSGFLIYGTLINKNKTDFFQYLQRRIVRIYPTFLTVFLIYLGLSLLFPNENKIPNNLWDGALYITQNLLLLPGLFDITPMITVAWSLSYELFYYLLIPLIIALLNLRKWTLKQRVIFWVAVSIVGFIYFQIYGGPYRLLMFISGILLYEVFKNKLIEPPRYIGNFAFLMAFGTYAFAQHLELSGIIQMATLYLFFFVVCLEAFSNNDGSAVWLNITPIRWLGNMSYSYYLIHGLTLKACFMFLALIESPQKQFDTIFWLAMPILFFATLISSFILFILVERTFSLKQNNRRAIIEVNKKNEVNTLST